MPRMYSILLVITRLVLHFLYHTIYHETKSKAAAVVQKMPEV